jgi:hypothetical protein
MPDLWLGSSYGLPQHRVLVLGESWYGDVDPLIEYIPKWAAFKLKDATFARIFNAASGLDTATATATQRLDWWHTVAFYNFVPGSVGRSRDSRPTRAHYLSAAEPLELLLEEIGPAGVWIFGIEQSAYSAPIIAHHAIPYEVAPHPASYGLKRRTLQVSWQSLLAKRSRPLPR